MACLWAICFTMAAAMPQTPSKIFIVTADPTNDVLSLLRKFPNVVHASSVQSALNDSVSGDGVMLLSDHYPVLPTAVPASLISAAASGLRVFVEFPSGLPIAPRQNACVNGSSARGVSFVIESAVRSLCAPEAGLVQVEYSGTLCHGNAGEVLWDSMRTLNPDPKLPPTQICAWNASAESASWAQLFTGSCGVAPTLLPHLPVRICSPSPSPPPPTPQPPSKIVNLSWTKRAVVTSDKLNYSGVGLPRWSILQVSGLGLGLEILRFPYSRPNSMV